VLLVYNNMAAMDVVHVKHMVSIASCYEEKQAAAV
jgi:hypothetical protein